MTASDPVVLGPAPLFATVSLRNRRAHSQTYARGGTSARMLHSGLKGHHAGPQKEGKMLYRLCTWFSSLFLRRRVRITLKSGAQVTFRRNDLKEVVEQDMKSAITVSANEPLRYRRRNKAVIVRREDISCVEVW